jgi:hypothetical protein
MKPHDPKDEDDEADDCPPLPVVAQDGEAEEEDDDGNPEAPSFLKPASIVFIVLIFLALSAACKGLNSVIDSMSHLGH